MFGLSPLELMIVGLVCPGLLGAGVIVAVLFAVRRNPAPSNPNLLPCPDCGRLLSRQAITCPQCGRPMNSPPG